jgi:hypothetical protein
MRVLVRRLRKLEEGLLPPAETAESRRVHEIVMDMRRARAARLGIPEPEDDPEPVYRRGMSIGDTIRASVQRMRERRAAEETGARL